MNPVIQSTIHSRMVIRDELIYHRSDTIVTKKFEKKEKGKKVHMSSCHSYAIVFLVRSCPTLTTER